MGAGIQLFMKGKIPILPSSVKGKAEIAKIFAASAKKL